ncbi:serine/threonine-protein kinase pim-2-like isoform X2 [Onychostoma macrolepis]|uniref:serine/threonine-protein kinase pim-2-like isoform X2 n=1 Tax=Onychostoma macrolepis TaxID=369639 RepID=UPI00272BD4CC|nr:serine/threonine-protein kinase pim-2-like isoform X2 [Onychostoma macrolepis]
MDADSPETQPSSGKPEQQNNPTEKHTKGRKGFRSLRKAVKRHFQSLKTKVCRGVPEGEPSQENPQTSRAEPTADTDPLEAQQVFDYAQATQSRAVASAESSSDVFEDAFEYFPAENSRAQPSSENNPEQQSNPTEKHTKGRKGFRSLRKAVKRHFQSLKTKVCRGVPEGEPSQENPQTSRAEPTGYDFFRWTPLNPICVLRLQPEAEYFRSLYEVGEELASGRFACLHEGIRRSDGQQVLIKFARRRWAIDRMPYDDSFCSALCEEAIIMLALQRPPSCEHVIRLYDWFTVMKRDVLVMENPRPCVTLSEFIRQNRCHLNEETARRILQQLTVALKHCLDRGVLHYTDFRRVLMNTDTLQLKIINFRHARLVAASSWAAALSSFNPGSSLFQRC